jgi:TATA-binding protein-associated factor Taf7
MQSIFKLTDLQQRKEPKRQKDFAISYAVKKSNIEQKKEDTEEDGKENGDESGEGESREREPREGEAKESHNIKFNDKRKSTLVDRNLILQRLHRPVENKKISKSPVIVNALIYLFNSSLNNLCCFGSKCLN